MNSTTQINSERLPQLNPTALALAFGVAGLVIVILFAAVMGGMSGMTHGGGAGWMHGSAGIGPGYGGAMMAGGLGFFVSALVCGFLGGALAGGVSAAVYNNVVGGRNGRPQ
ncbi:MAG TPA: hypothetical protein VGU66_19980 [Candidatus Elarobacter sp.]|nr:hypothetical protein [Candidatus Elarobacter sp.]